MKRFSRGIGVIIIFFCVMGLSFTAHAESGVPYYAVLKGGIYSPQNSNLDSFDTGFNGNFALGYYLNKNFAFELESGYFHSSANKSVNNQFLSGKGTLNINVVPLTLGFKGIIPIDNFELYGIGGGGAYFAWSDSSVAVNNQNRSSSNNYNQTLVGGFLGVGVNYNITPTVYVGLEGKYLWTSSLTVDNIDTDTNLNGIIATFNLGFRF